MISLLNNVQSGQEPKARVKDTTGGAIAQNYRGVPSSRPNLGWSQITSARLCSNSEVSNVAYWPFATFQIQAPSLRMVALGPLRHLQQRCDLVAIGGKNRHSRPPEPALLTQSGRASPPACNPSGHQFHLVSSRWRAAPRDEPPHRRIVENAHSLVGRSDGKFAGAAVRWRNCI
jgi:hypothetical protein